MHMILCAQMIWGDEVIIPRNENLNPDQHGRCSGDVSCQMPEEKKNEIWKKENLIRKDMLEEGRRRREEKTGRDVNAA